MLYQFQVYSKVNQLICILNISILFSHIICYEILNSFPCAIQQVLVNYLFYVQQCVYTIPILLIYPFPRKFDLKFFFNFVSFIILSIFFFSSLPLPLLLLLLLLFLLFLLLLLLHHAWSMQKFPGQGYNPCRSSDSAECLTARNKHFWIKESLPRYYQTKY